MIPVTPIHFCRKGTPRLAAAIDRPAEIADMAHVLVEVGALLEVEDGGIAQTFSVTLPSGRIIARGVYAGRPYTDAVDEVIREAYVLLGGT